MRSGRNPRHLHVGRLGTVEISAEILYEQRYPAALAGVCIYALSCHEVFDGGGLLGELLGGDWNTLAPSVQIITCVGVFDGQGPNTSTVLLPSHSAFYEIEASVWCAELSWISGIPHVGGVVDLA